MRIVINEKTMTVDLMNLSWSHIELIQTELARCAIDSKENSVATRCCEVIGLIDAGLESLVNSNGDLK